MRGRCIPVPFKMFHAMMDNLGVMDIIAPFSESNEVVLAIQSRDWNRTLDALSSGVPLTQLTSTKCGVLHLAAQYNFVQLIEYMRNQTAMIDEKDGVSDRPCCSPFLCLLLFYASLSLMLCRKGTLHYIMPREMARSSPRQF